MKVLLANPPWLREGWYGVRAGSRWPHMERADSPYMPFPFLLGYAAAVLEEDGIEVAAIDACAEKLDRTAFLDRVGRERPDVLLLEVSTPSLTEDLETIRALRQDLRYDGDLLLAGLHKPLYEPSFLETHPGIDATLVGEYEVSLLHWVRLREDGAGRPGGVPERTIPGVIHRGPDGALRDGGRKPSQRQLDEIPWPARHLFPMERYHDLPGGIPGPSVQLWASRGCSFGCSFCAWPQILYADHLYRTRHPDRVAEEVIAQLGAGYSSFYFDDDTFNLGRKRTGAIADAFVKAGISHPWAFMGRADTCDESQYETLARTGLRAVKFGVESADTARLKRIGKNLDVERVRTSVKAVRALDIKVHLTFMFGLPGETLETMQRTLDLAYELDPDSAQFTVAVPFPGSQLHDELHEQGRLTDVDWANLDGYRTGVVRTDALLPEQIVSFVHGVHRRWERRSRPPGPAPRIPVAEIGGSPVAIALLAPRGSAPWLEEGLRAVVAQEGPSREILVVAEAGDPELEPAAARGCDWATFLESPNGSVAAMANRVPSGCSSSCFAFLLPGQVPPQGWLLAVLEAVRANPERGALALPLLGATGSGGLALTRWGLLRAVAPGAASPVLGVALGGGVFRRDLWEDVGGLDDGLPTESAALDLALRGLALGWRCASAAAPALVPPDDAGPTPLASRLRLLLRAVPRELLREATIPLAMQVGAELLRDPRAARELWALGGGWRKDLEVRRATLGRRRAGDPFLRRSYLASEALTGSGRWAKAMQALVGAGEDSPREG
jgi:radical SAM superfamily enzyme YgiQ (UPF0313 family)